MEFDFAPESAMVIRRRAPPVGQRCLAWNLDAVLRQTGIATARWATR